MVDYTNSSCEGGGGMSSGLIVERMQEKQVVALSVR